MKTYHIHINGIVQGVGFRPSIYNLAKELKLKGQVKNGNDGVHIYFNASEPAAFGFLKKIQQHPPSKSIITQTKLEQVINYLYKDFSIVVEKDDFSKTALITPDVALCNNCRRELHSTKDRRYRYAFISCTQCGPRYSILENLPYEREYTAMQPFKMCDECGSEYEDIKDRRFFSQTSSCSQCSIGLSIMEKDLKTVSTDSEVVLQKIKMILEQGKIVAVKGIGGYLLLCDANNPDTIRTLREGKRRPYKPFALLYPDIKSVGETFKLHKKEKELLESAAAPIVLLYAKKAANNVITSQVAPGLNRLGVMLPYAPLLDLVATDFGRPLIATSANISGSPIIYKEEDAHEFLFNIADAIVDNERNIIVPQDDSVVQVTRQSRKKIILRRSRGYAPSFLKYEPKKERSVLATGAFLKSSFTLSVNGNVFVSQFLGSGESYESQQMYRNTLMHWFNLYKLNPATIISDMHPGYFSHLLADELDAKYGSEIMHVQHHEAHLAAVLAENKLLDTEQSVLGVVWDGTGLGLDGNIWGGEFFRYRNKEILRCYHFDYFPAIAGDKLALEPRIAALCTCCDTWPQPETLRQKFTEAEWNNYHSLMETTNLFSSSAGRIFDAVASLLDICDKQTYEGEAAMYLQALAETYVDEHGFEMDECYFKDGAHYYRIPTATLMQGIILDIRKGKEKNYIAAKFHYSMVCIVGIVAKNVEVETICFSGGVFQNALLVDWLQHKYNQKYKLCFHNNLSPNDENISFGQMVYYDNNIRTLSQNFENKDSEQELKIDSIQAIT